jgi:nucleotide-binding universal stress UspA family protein
MATTNAGNSTRPIVVGVDGSASSSKALRWAATQARLTSARLQVITVWSYPSSYEMAVGLEEWQPDEDAAKAQSKVLGSLAEPLDSVEVERHLIEGDPANVLLDASRAGSLLVVGSRGHREFAGLFLGSVSRHLVTHAQVPVVVVHA